MTDGKFSSPDYFASNPLLAILPVRGRLGKLEDYSASLFARYEKVSGLIKELSDSSDREAARRLYAEQGMLRQVLDWLSITPKEA